MKFGGKAGGKGAMQFGAEDVMFAMQVMNSMGGMGNQLMGFTQAMGGVVGKGGAKGKGKDKGFKSQKGIAQAPKKNKQIHTDLPWKSRLAQAYSTTHKTPPTKDSLVYTATPVEGAGYTCTLSCDKFSNEYETEEVFESKKMSEEAVAMAALKGEFPAIFNAVPGAMKKKGAMGGSGAALATKIAAFGGKRKTPAEGPSDPVSRLNTGILILAGRPVTKEDFEYTIEEVNGSSVAVLTLHCFDEMVFKGKPSPGTSKESKKLAKQSAATLALKAYQSQITAKLPEHEASKEAKRAQFEAKVALKLAGKA